MIQLIVGDWGGDGHDTTKEFLVTTTSTKDEIEASYKAGVKIVGVDLVKDFCTKCEDRKIPDEVLDQLKEHGVVVGEDDDWTDDDGTVHREIWIHPETFAAGYLSIAKVGNPNLEAHILNDLQCIYVGGYGLDDFHF